MQILHKFNFVYQNRIYDEHKNTNARLYKTSHIGRGIIRLKTVESLKKLLQNKIQLLEKMK